MAKQIVLLYRTNTRGCTPLYILAIDGLWADEPRILDGYIMRLRSLLRCNYDGTALSIQGITNQRDSSNLNREVLQPTEPGLSLQLTEVDVIESLLLVIV